MVVKAVKEVPKAVAAGIVDMDSGMLLAVKTTESHPQEVLDFVSAAKKEMFEGENVTIVENIFKKIRGVSSDEKYFKEIIVFSKNLLHFFGRCPSNERIVMVIVTSADANMGMLMMKSRSIIKELQI